MRICKYNSKFEFGKWILIYITYLLNGFQRIDSNIHYSIIILKYSISYWLLYVNDEYKNLFSKFKSKKIIIKLIDIQKKISFTFIDNDIARSNHRKLNF